jgi:hypothetical protein
MTKSFSLILSLIPFASFYGCTAGGAAPGQLVTLPSRVDGVENVHVIRDKSWLGASRRFYLTVNGEDVAKLKNGDVVRFGLESGDHTIGIRCPRMPEGPRQIIPVDEWHLEESVITVQEPEITEVHVGTEVHLGMRCYVRVN